MAMYRFLTVVRDDKRYIFVMNNDDAVLAMPLYLSLVEVTLR